MHPMSLSNSQTNQKRRPLIDQTTDWLSFNLWKRKENLVANIWFIEVLVWESHKKASCHDPQTWEG